MLAEGLATSASLQELTLSAAGIGDNGAARIASALQVNTALVRLDIVLSGISDRGAASFAEASLICNSSLLRTSWHWPHTSECCSKLAPLWHVPFCCDVPSLGNCCISLATMIISMPARPWQITTPSHLLISARMRSPAAAPGGFSRPGEVDASYQRV